MAKARGWEVVQRAEKRVTRRALNCLVLGGKVLKLSPARRRQPRADCLWVQESERRQQAPPSRDRGVFSGTMDGERGPALAAGCMQRAQAGVKGAPERTP